MRTGRISRRWAAVAAALAVFAAVPVASAADFAVDAVAVDAAVDALAADAALSVTTTTDAVTSTDVAPPVDPTPAPPVVEVPPVDPTPAPPVVEAPPVDPTPAPPVVEAPPVDPTPAPPPVVDPVPVAVTPTPEIGPPVTSNPIPAISTAPTSSSTATISEIAAPAPVTPLPTPSVVNGTPFIDPTLPRLVPLSIESPAFAIPRELSRQVMRQAPDEVYRSAAAQSAPSGLLVNMFLAEGPLGTSRMAGLLAFMIGLLPFAPADGKSGMGPPPQLAVLILGAALAAFAALTLPLRDGRRRGPRGYATLALRPG